MKINILKELNKKCDYILDNFIDNYLALITMSVAIIFSISLFLLLSVVMFNIFVN